MEGMAVEEINVLSEDSATPAAAKAVLKTMEA